MNIIDLNLDNINNYPSICFCKKGSVGYTQKLDWMKKRLKEGLKIKVLTDDEKIRGYIEYTNGENAWRAVDAKGHIFINCIWISPNKYKDKGYGSQLINKCKDDAKGVVVITSDDSFMASKDIFLKNGFKVIQEDGKQQLLVKPKKGTLPKFKDYRKQLSKYKGWHIVYSKQCPWVARFIDELDEKVINKLNLEITELKTPKQAQNGPSIYGIFTLIKDGQILADHYISNTRFKNIIKKANSH